MRACFAHARFLISPNLEVYGKIAWSVLYVENGSRTNIFDGITIPHTLFASSMEQEFQTPCYGSAMMAGSSCARIANTKIMVLFGRLLTCCWICVMAAALTLLTELWRPRCWICHCHRMATLLDLRAAVDTDESLPGDRCQTHRTIPDCNMITIRMIGERWLNPVLNSCQAKATEHRLDSRALRSEGYTASPRRLE